MAGKRRKKRAGPRFQRGTDDLDQLHGIERQKQRSRRKRKRRADNDNGPTEEYPLIESDEKSRKRVKNRLDRIKVFGDAIDEFGS